MRRDHWPAPELVAAGQRGGTATRTAGIHGRSDEQRDSHYVPGGHRLVAVVGGKRHARGPVRADGVRRVRVRVRRCTSVRVPLPSLLCVRGPRTPGLRVRIAGRGRSRVHHDEQRQRHRTVSKRVLHSHDIPN